MSVRPVHLSVRHSPRSTLPRPRWRRCPRWCRGSGTGGCPRSRRWCWCKTRSVGDGARREQGGTRGGRNELPGLSSAPQSRVSRRGPRRTYSIDPRELHAGVHHRHRERLPAHGAVPQQLPDGRGFHRGERALLLLHLLHRVLHVGRPQEPAQRCGERGARGGGWTPVGMARGRDTGFGAGLLGQGVKGCCKDELWSQEALEQHPELDTPSQDTRSPSVAPQTSFFSMSRYRGLSGKQCSSRSWREAGITTTARNRGQYLSWNGTCHKKKQSRGHGSRLRASGSPCPAAPGGPAPARRKPPGR